jgi:VanZ family protein
MPFKMTALFKILFWVALIGSYVAAVVPQEVAPHIGSLSDKGIHFIAFAVLTLLFSFAYRTVWARTSLLLLAYAVFIEVSQLFTPNRSAELLDVVADVIGITIGLLSVFLLRNYVPGFKTDEKH